MNLPIPYHMFVNMFVRKSTARLILNGHQFRDAKQQAVAASIIEKLDYTELRSVLHMLKDYPALNFVDIEAADGTIVKIANT